MDATKICMNGDRIECEWPGIVNDVVHEVAIILRYWKILFGTCICFDFGTFWVNSSPCKFELILYHSTNVLIL